jgi:hypothetical protein
MPTPERVRLRMKARKMAVCDLSLDYPYTDEQSARIEKWIEERTRWIERLLLAKSIPTA